MADVKKQKKAEKAFTVLCNSLNEDKWIYTKDEKKLFVEYKVRGDDLVMPCKYFIDVDREVVRFLSKIPAEFTQEQIMEAAVACCLINNKLLYGAFDLNIQTGAVWFRMSNAMRDGIPGKDFFRWMRRKATDVIDLYNDRFEKLQKGEIKAVDIID